MAIMNSFKTNTDLEVIQNVFLLKIYQHEWTRKIQIQAFTWNIIYHYH